MRRRGGSEQPVKGQRANRPKTRKVSTAAPSITDLEKQVGLLTRELKEARAQVMSGSAFELGPVLQITRNALLSMD